MKELYRFRQFLAEGVIKEDNLKDYWSEWAAGEVKVGNDDVIDAGGVDADFKDVPDDTMDTFKRYVKAVKTLNASSKELRDDIAGAISGIFYGGGEFEDYEFDVLTSDQFDKIGLLEGRVLKEVMDEEMVDYVSAMYDSDVDQEAEEGFQSDVWSKAQYASNAYNESSIFLELIDHLKSVGGKDVVEGNPDIHLELLSNGDIKWSADVTHS